MKPEDFKLGMKVKMYDEDDKKTIVGEVKQVFDDRVSIHWEDLSASTDHKPDEYPLISPADEYKHRPNIRK